MLSEKNEIDHKGLTMADEMLRNRVVYEKTDMEKKCSREDRVYKTASSHELKMAIYIPNQLPAGSILPGIIFIHGGPFPSDISLLPTEWGQYISLGQLAAAFGLIGITFHHRYHRLGLIGESALDVEDAIKYVRENADKFCLDPDNLCLWVISGGGPLLSTTLRKRPDYLKCVVAYYARLDMRGFNEAEKILNKETLHKFSPAAIVEEADSLTIPIFVARAGLDKPDLNQSIDKFLEVALSKNVPIEFCNHQQGRHAFDILDNFPQSKEIIRKSMEFVRLNLKEGK
jgi:acetyl esterase/lipase